MVVILINIQAILHLGILFYADRDFVGLVNESRYFLTKLTSAWMVILMFVKRQQIGEIFVELEYLLGFLGVRKRLVDLKVVIWCLVIWSTIGAATASSQAWIWTNSHVSYKWTDELNFNLTRDLLSRGMKTFFSAFDSFIFTVCSFGTRMAIGGMLSLICDLLLHFVKGFNDHLESLIDNPHHIPSANSCGYIRIAYDSVSTICHRIEHTFGFINFVLFGTTFLFICSDVLYLATCDDLGANYIRIVNSTVFLIPSLILFWTASNVRYHSAFIHGHVESLLRMNPEGYRHLFSPKLFPALKVTLWGFTSIDRMLLFTLLSTVISFSVMTLEIRQHHLEAGPQALNCSNQG